MKTSVGLAAVCAALALASVATAARAKTGDPVSPFSGSAYSDTTTAGPATLSPNAPRKSLQWDSKGRWGLKFDYQQPAPSTTGWRDIDAGMYYKLTPQLHIGGSVGLTDQPLSHIPLPEQSAQPHVRLETTFKF
jgi:hypothetical protein